MYPFYEKIFFVLKFPQDETKEGQRQKQKKIKFAPLRIQEKTLSSFKKTINDCIPCTSELENRECVFG
jgi:hypothetical protein